MPLFLLASVIWQVLAKQPVLGALCPGVWAMEVNLPHGEPPVQENERWVGPSGQLSPLWLSAVCAPQVEKPVEDLQTRYYLLPPAQLPPRYLLHCVPPPPPSSSLPIVSDPDKENTGE